MNELALAREAILYTLPLYEMARMRCASSPRRNARGDYADSEGGPQSTLRWVNLFSHSRQLLGPANRRVVTPNNDTLYTNAWLDLSRGPLLVHAPDTAGRYYVLGFLDFYTNPFAYTGTRTTGTGAQVLFVHGPDWRGSVPQGAIEVAAPTDHVWVLGRILAMEDEALEPVHALQDAFRIVRPAAPDVALYGERLDTGMQPHDLPGDPETYLRVVNRELAMNPPPPREATLVARFAALGIGAALSKPGEMTVLGKALGEVLQELDTPQPSNLGGGWMLLADVKTSFGEDWHMRALVARAYIGMLGIEEVMYLMADVDATGAPLDGQRTYRLRFAPGAEPDVGAFWSLTMYRKSDFMLVDNPINRYSIGDRTHGLVRDADGGLTITMSHTAPRASTNWLPAPAEAFYVSLRMYMPGKAHVERTFKYPPIQSI